MLKDIDLVVWDFDGVFGFNYDKDGYVWARRLAAETDIDMRALSKALFGNAEFRRILTGEMDLIEELAKILPDCGWNGTAEEFVHLWFSNDFTPNEGMLDLMEDVRQSGRRCVLGTNNERHRMKYILHEWGFDGKFDAIYAAGHMGVAKPDHGFFDHIMKAEDHADRARVLFIDDHPENISSANEYGWRGHLFGHLHDFELGNTSDLRTALGL